MAPDAPRTVNQINLTFDPREDRILMRVASVPAGGTEEISEVRMWLTRRYVRLLWQVLEKIADESVNRLPQASVTNKPVLKKLQAEADLSQADFKTPYKAASPGVKPKTPLGEAPLLLSKIQVKQSPQNQQVMFLGTEEGKGIHLGLTTQLIHSLMKLLADTSRKAAWDLPFSLPGQTPAPVPPVDSRKLM